MSRLYDCKSPSYTLWPAEYESSSQFDEFEQDSAGKVETEVEGTGWPFEPRPHPAPLSRFEVDVVIEFESLCYSYCSTGSALEEGPDREHKRTCANSA